MSTTTQQTVKQRLQMLLDKLPADCTVEQLQYHLYVLQAVESGLEAVDRGEGIPHEEVKRRLSKWLPS